VSANTLDDGAPPHEKPALAPSLAGLLGFFWVAGPLVGLALMGVSSFERDFEVIEAWRWDPATGDRALVPALEGGFGARALDDGRVLVDGRDWVARWDPASGRMEPVDGWDAFAQWQVWHPPAGLDIGEAADEARDPARGWDGFYLPNGEDLLLIRFRDGAWRFHARVRLTGIGRESAGTVLRDGRLMLINDACAAAIVPASPIDEVGSPALTPLPWALAGLQSCWQGVTMTTLSSGDAIAFIGPESALRWSSRDDRWRAIGGHETAGTIQVAPLPGDQLLVLTSGRWEQRANPSGIAGFAIGAALLLASLVTAAWIPRRRRLPGVRVGMLVAGIVAAVVAIGTYLMLLATVSGRPLRVGRRTHLPRIVRVGRRTRAGTCDVGPIARLALRRHWTHAARLEASSVPTFERLAAELDLLGAPRSLVERARAAASDETRHAALCAEIAAHFGARPFVCAPLAPELSRSRPACTPALLAHEALIDGVHGEGVAAAMAHASLADTNSPGVHAALTVIAEDEARHAALAEDVLVWCRAIGEASVERAVARGFAELARRPRWHGMPRHPSNASLWRHGIFAEARPGALDRACFKALEARVRWDARPARP